MGGGTEEAGGKWWMHSRVGRCSGVWGLVMGQERW